MIGKEVDNVMNKGLADACVKDLVTEFEEKQILMIQVAMKIRFLVTGSAVWGHWDKLMNLMIEKNEGCMVNFVLEDAKVPLKLALL